MKRGSPSSLPSSYGFDPGRRDMMVEGWSATEPWNDLR